MSEHDTVIPPNEAFDQAKLDAIYTIRIPGGTKAMIERLNLTWRTKMNEDVRETIARVLHEANFDKSIYLG